MDSFVTTIALVGTVVVVASLLSGAIERRGIPLVSVFLLLGAALGPWGLAIADVGFHDPALHALAMLGLALLLFSDAVTLDTRQIRTQRALLWRLLGPGTLAPATISAVAAWLLLDLPAPAAAILGAALASTDPVLLRTLLRSKALPDAPRLALRLETGMNDVVLLPIVILSMLFLPGAYAPGGTAAIPTATITHSILGLFVLGPLLGALVGWVGITALASVREHTGVRRDYESLYALGLAFSAFAAAEAVGGSGFVAAFAAGLLVATNDIELCDCFLEYGEATAEMLLLLTFVALGTTLIWTGLTIIGWRTLLFAAIALGSRSAVLLPVLGGAGLSPRDRRLVALFGPRGLSSLLLALLPVFAGLPGAEQVFQVTCLVVLLSVVIHGGGTAFFLRAGAARERSAGPMSSPGAEVLVPLRSAADESSMDGRLSAELITLDELRLLQSMGEPTVIVDARAERSYLGDPLQPVGAVRVRPEDPARDARALRLSTRANLIVYCA
jgi:NhaP-type Na+/H+ or K+/H+ antiporter